MTIKTIRNHKYKWAASRGTESEAKKLKDKINRSIYVHAVVIAKKLGSKTALVPTVYEIWVRPTDEGKKNGYGLDTSKIETFIRTQLI